MPFTVEQDKFILEAYFRNGQKDVDGNWKYSVRLCVEEYQTHFQNIELDDDVLCRHIRRIVSRFHEHGSVCKGKSTGRTTVLTEEVVEDVRTYLERSPTKPLRQLAQQAGLSYGTCHKAVKRQLHLHRYKITVVQELLPLDFQKCLQYLTPLDYFLFGHLKNQI
ncbi:hypothetical protein FQA39_LY16203 [Lamprigera yunnana]|nr:hypothetical protein FQA39_LY16203 [Lamprigera yunnana]